MTMKASISVLAAALCLGATGALADTTVGVTDTGDCYPFNCNDTGITSGQSIDYEQIYSSSAFSGRTSIDSLSFYAFDPGVYGDASLIAGSYQIILGTTNDPLGSPYPLTLSNVQVFPTSTSVGVSTSSFLTFLLGSPYNYNPADGNLVMEVIVTNQASVPNGAGGGYFEADDSQTSMSRAYLRGDGTAEVILNLGLVTTFGEVPEPAAWALMLVGFAGLGAALRSRRRFATA